MAIPTRYSQTCREGQTCDILPCHRCTAIRAPTPSPTVPPVRAATMQAGSAQPAGHSSNRSALTHLHHAPGLPEQGGEKRKDRRNFDVIAWHRNTCSSVEQSGQNDARRLHHWLEHGSKAQLQRILSGRFAGASRQVHAKAASTSSLMGGKELCRGALSLPCSSVEQSGENDDSRLHRWLEHGSKAQLQRILSGRFAGA